MTACFCKKRERVDLWLLLTTKVDLILYVAWQCIVAVFLAQVAVSGQSGRAWLCMRRGRLEVPVVVAACLEPLNF